MRFLRFCGKTAVQVASAVGAIILIIWLWWDHTALLLQINDLNLKFLKEICRFIPYPNGAKIEAAMLALSFEKVILFGEGELFFLTLFWGIWAITQKLRGKPVLAS